MGFRRSPVHLLGVVGASAASVGVGLVLVFKLITPQSVARLATHELFGLLALLVLPVLTLAVVRQVRRVQVVHVGAPAAGVRGGGGGGHARAHGGTQAIARLQAGEGMGGAEAHRKADRHRRRVAGQRAG